MTVLKLDLFAIVLIFLAEAFLSHAEAAGDFSVGVLLGSHHVASDGFVCDGARRDFNETNPGVYLRYKNLFVGRYENSYSGCAGVWKSSGLYMAPKYSTVIGAEADLGELGPVEFSVTGALADGYPDDGDAFGEYRPWASINAKVGIFKVFYSYKVVAFGLQVDL